MTVLTTASAVAFVGDGRRQIFPFQAGDVFIPHGGPDEICIKVDGKALPKEAYTLTIEPKATIITLLSPPAVGAVIEIERQTPLIQPRKFRRSSDWDLDAVEAAFDRLTRAVQDAFYRIGRIERSVDAQIPIVPVGPDQGQVEEMVKRIVEQALPQEINLSEDLVASLADVIAAEIDKQRQTVNEQLLALSTRIGQIETALQSLYHATGEKAA